MGGEEKLDRAARTSDGGEIMEADESQHAACAVRVVNIYATPWRFNGKLHDDEGTPTDLSGLETHYELYKEQLPRLLPDRVLGDLKGRGKVALARRVEGITVNDPKAELFTLPSKQVVLAITMCLAGGMLTDEQRAEPISKVLEQCIVGDIKIGGRMVADVLNAMFAESPAKDFFSKDSLSESLLPERHQLVFVARPTQTQSVPNQQVIDKILYRSSPPYRPEFVTPRRPQQLNSHLKQSVDGASWAEPPMGLPNRRRNDADQDDSAQKQTLGIVTPYASLLYGQEKYVEASIFLSTVHAVGTAARFRHIWREAYQQALWFREQKQETVAGKQTRDSLEFLADNLGNLEFDLTVSVEFPLLRIETFKSDLYDAMDLDNQAEALSQMFDQLGGSLRSEITAIEVRERRRAERRMRWNSIAASLLSLIGVPVGFVIAFLGINTTEVPDTPNKSSMWDSRYAVLYLVASSFALTPVFLILFPYLREVVLPRKDRRALWWGMAIMVLGAVAFVRVLMSDQYETGLARIIDAFVTALSVFSILVGLVLIVLWAWRYVLKAFGKQQSGSGGPPNLPNG
jgi:hypothetical protein